jgi:hypothetical protein
MIPEETQPANNRSSGSAERGHVAFGHARGVRLETHGNHVYWDSSTKATLPPNKEETGRSAGNACFLSKTPTSSPRPAPFWHPGGTPGRPCRHLAGRSASGSRH